MTQEGHGLNEATITDAVEPPAAANDPTADQLLTIVDDVKASLASMQGDLFATPVDGEDESTKVSDEHRSFQDFCRWVEGIAAAPARQQAAESLVHSLAHGLGCNAVRLAVGGGKLQQVFDHRLGWLSPDVPLRSEVESIYLTQRQEATIPRVVVLPDDSAVLLLPHPGRDLFCCVWMMWNQPQRCSESVKLQGLEKTLTTVFWSRPKMRLPERLAKLSRKTRALLGTILVLATFASLWPVDYPVRCQVTVQPSTKRVISAPFEASLLEANHKPGDVVQHGDVLLTLDGRPLRLERESATAQWQQAKKDHDIALATGQVADAQIAALKQRRLARRLDRLNDQLKRLVVTSPIDGVVLGGELDRHVGTTLTTGQSLTEVAPLQKMVLELEIHEHDLPMIVDNAETRVRLPAISGPSLRGRLGLLSPASEMRDDQNVFVGQMVIDNDSSRLRPGMRGDAVIYGPLRPWIWTQIRDPVEQCLWWIGY